MAEGAIIALAGRRIDAVTADPAVFPLSAVPMVRDGLRALFRDVGATALVCSAACGADLVALDVAGTLGMRRRVVLPFAAARFRETSVVDRPGDWGPLFDRIMAETGAGVVVLSGAADDAAAYAAANAAIVREAQALDPGPDRAALIAVVVWEGAARSGSDATDGFRRLAADAGFGQRSVLTRPA